MPYLGKTPSQATRKRYYKTASAGDTSVSGTMTVGGTLTFTDGEFVDVSVNGVALVAGTDYNTNTANTIAGLSALAANDQVEIVVYDTFSVFSGDVDSNMSVGGNLSVTGTTALTGNATASGTASIAGHASIGVDAVNSARALTVAGATDGSSSTILQLYNSSLASKFSVRDDGFVDVAGTMTITTADNTAQLTLKSTDADSTVGPVLDLVRDSGSPADSDNTGAIVFKADDDGGNSTEFAKIETSIVDASDTTEDGRLLIRTMTAGTATSRLDFTPTETVFNDSSIDLDFRVEGNGNANALVVHGADDFVGIGLGTPKKRLHIQDSSSDGMIILDRADTSADHQICFAHNYGNSNQSGGNYYAIGVDDSENKLVFAFDANSQASLSADAKMVLDSSGRVLINRTSESSVNPHSKLHVLADSAVSAATIQIGTNGYAGISFLNAAGSDVGSIVINASSTAYNTSSDYRLKKGVQDMTGAIDRVKALAPKRFQFTAEPDTTVDGFLAHEAQTVVPEAITGTKDETREVTNAVLSSDGRLIGEDVTEAKWTAGKLATEEDGKTIPAIYPSDSTWSAKHTEPVMQGIDQAKLVPLLTGALQEAIAEIETLKTKVAALEAG